MEVATRYELLLTLDYVLKYCKALNLELLSYETCLGILPSTENDEKIIRELSPIEIELFLVSGTLGKELIEASAKEDSPNWKYNTMSAIHEVCTGMVYDNLYYTNFRDRKERAIWGVRRYKGKLWFVERPPTKQEKLSSLLKSVRDILKEE